MKAMRFMIIIYMLALPEAIMAQCSTTILTLSFDTTVTGNGEEVHNFSFPKFNIPTGTLLEIQLRSEVTISYGFTAENTLASPYSNYRVRVTRGDDINSTSFNAGPVNMNFPTTTYGFYNFTASDGNPGSGTDFHEEPVGYALNHITRQQNFTNTADYLGTGMVDFDYTINSTSIVPFGTNSSIPLNSTSADTLTFSITYVYCQTSILASDIFTFIAQKRDETTIDINWINYNESETRSYILEKSLDGTDFRYVEVFTALASENKAGNFQFQYHPPAGEQGKIFFRIKQIQKDGSIKYSTLRVVELSKSTGHKVRIYPNPGDGQVGILFHNQKHSDWIVEIFSMNGQLLQRYSFINTLLAKMDLRNKLPKGTYLLKATHKRSEEQSVQKIIIQ